MSEEKQIEELANDIASICPDLVDSGCMGYDCVACLTRKLNKLGYRKQSKGEWVYNPSGEMLLGTDAPLDYVCSLCGNTATDPFCYCPDCGAKMKGGAE